MNEKDAWKNFISSGSVTDYLKYASIKKDPSDSPEEKNEVQHGRTSYKRTEYQGTGQINNSINKK